ncbi:MULTISPECIES: TIGR03086 family metal-binding protein [Amycolatopsis]|nr:TIGR03086 family metal-binding protein [Amycolatopsis sacchari]
MNPLDEFDRAAAAVTGIVSAVEPGQLELPTACTEWSVGDVIAHLLYGNVRAVAFASGSPPPDQVPLGDDHVAAFERSVREVRAALSEPGLLERTVQTPFGPSPGVLLVHMRRNEFLAHGWDIADATGQSTDFEPELVERAIAQWRERADSVPRGPGAPFAAEKSPPPGASAADRLAALLGRESVRGGR